MNAFEFEEVLSIAADRPDPFGLENPMILMQLNFVRGGFILGCASLRVKRPGRSALGADVGSSLSRRRWQKV